MSGLSLGNDVMLRDIQKSLAFTIISRKSKDRILIMKIYVGHSSSMNYREDLYKPLKQSKLNEEHELVFPHEETEEKFNSKQLLEEECDLFIAEVSNPSTGLGIELGWANLLDIKTICIHKQGKRPSSSISEVTEIIEPYEGKDQLISTIQNLI